MFKPTSDNTIRHFVVLQFYWAADIMTTYATALHILSFAIIRYISIKYPTTFNKMTFVHTKVRVIESEIQ